MPTIFKPKKKREYSHDPDNKRQKRQDIYNTNRWRNLRLAKLMRYPKCEICELEGRVTLAEDVHHALSFLDVPEDMTLQVAFDADNLVSVCKRCHHRCHTGDLKGTQSLEDIKERIKCNVNNLND